MKSNKKILCVAAVILASLLSLTYIASLTASFDLDKGIQAATDPFVALISKYYVVGIIAGSIGGIIFGRGDLKRSLIKLKRGNKDE
jgi:hypothetical protein